jgi:hypothetical protein
MIKRQSRMTNRTRPPIEEGAHYVRKCWEPVLSLAALQAELDRRKELSDMRSELERRLEAIRTIP